MKLQQKWDVVTTGAGSSIDYHRWQTPLLRCRRKTLGEMCLENGLTPWVMWWFHFLRSMSLGQLTSLLFSGEWDQLPLLALMLQLGHIFRQSPATQVSSRGDTHQVWCPCGCVFLAKVTDSWYKQSTLIIKVESQRGGQMLWFPINTPLVFVPSDCMLSLFCSDHWTLCLNPSSEKVACVVHYESVFTMAWSRPTMPTQWWRWNWYLTVRKLWCWHSLGGLSVDGPWERMMV